MHHQLPEVAVADTHRLPQPTSSAWEWQLHGACRGADASIFFHPEGERGASRAARERAAKAVCGRCPVIDACREHAIATEEPYGVWGGMSETERDLERSRRARPRRAARDRCA